MYIQGQESNYVFEKNIKLQSFFLVLSQKYYSESVLFASKHYQNQKKGSVITKQILEF